MYLSDAIGALAVALDTGRGRIDTLARRLQERGLLPKSTGGSNRPEASLNDVVAILLAHVVGAGYGDVARTVSELIDYRHLSNRGDGHAGDYIANALRHLIALDTGVAGYGAANCSIAITNGSHPAIVVRIPTSDSDPLELAFTPDGEPWQPQKALGVFSTNVIPGLTLFKLANQLRELMPPKDERRTYRFEVAA